MVLKSLLFLQVVGVGFGTEWFTTKPWSCSIPDRILSTTLYNPYTNNDLSKPGTITTDELVCEGWVGLNENVEENNPIDQGNQDGLGRTSDPVSLTSLPVETQAQVSDVS